jgi:hypothetical protein
MIIKDKHKIETNNWRIKAHKYKFKFQRKIMIRKDKHKIETKNRIIKIEPFFN